jgi:hypothetical protein
MSELTDTLSINISISSTDHVSLIAYRLSLISYHSFTFGVCLPTFVQSISRMYFEANESETGLSSDSRFAIA